MDCISRDQLALLLDREMEDAGREHTDRALAFAVHVGHLGIERATVEYPEIAAAFAEAEIRLQRIKAALIAAEREWPQYDVTFAPDGTPILTNPQTGARDVDKTWKPSQQDIADMWSEAIDAMPAADIPANPVLQGLVDRYYPEDDQSETAQEYRKLAKAAASRPLLEFYQMMAVVHWRLWASGRNLAAYRIQECLHDLLFEHDGKVN